MKTATSLPTSDPAEVANTLGIADLSRLPRCGAKGPGTAAWLSGLGLPLPAGPNSWLALPGGGLIARLGNTEYLIEAEAAVVASVMQAERVAGVYPVLHQDCSLALCGDRVSELLLQVCNIDFRCLDLDPSQVLLTSMAGVGVTVLRRGSHYRLWCDGTYGRYLQDTLIGIAVELGGDSISPDALP